MTSDDLVTDEQLEKIISEAQNTQVDGSQYIKAKNMLEVRRNRKLFALQEQEAHLHVLQVKEQMKASELQLEILNSTKIRLDRIIKVLDKPLWIAVFASIWGLIIGVSINILTEFLNKFLFHLKP